MQFELFPSLPMQDPPKKFLDPLKISQEASRRLVDEFVALGLPRGLVETEIAKAQGWAQKHRKKVSKPEDFLRKRIWKRLKNPKHPF